MSTIFITGTSSGIGKASAKLFAEKGWKVIVTMRNLEKAEELKDIPNIDIYQLDITNLPQIKEVVAEVLAKEEVDVLFNNAGYGMRACFENMDDEMMYASMETNIVGMVHMTQAFIPYFKKRRQGMILTTTSLAGIIGLPLDGIYSADKWATQGMSEMLYYELYPYNIKVRTLIPGAVRSGFKMSKKEVEGYETVMANQHRMLVPDHDLVELPQEAAQDAYFAVTDTDPYRMDYVTGTVAKQLYEKRQQLGDEAFRQYLKKILMNDVEH